LGSDWNSLEKAQKTGASEGIRTLDIHLGKVTLYQAELRSLPLTTPQHSKNRRARKRQIESALAAARPRLNGAMPDAVKVE
jgi:hypothetical protein